MNSSLPPPPPPAVPLPPLPPPPVTDTSTSIRHHRPYAPSMSSPPSSSNNTQLQKQQPEQLGVYHPEYMFCGSCTTCSSAPPSQNDDEKKDDEETDDEDEQEEEDVEATIELPTISSSWSATRRTTNDAVIKDGEAIIVSHDDKNSSPPVSLNVRSTLFVQGICCASEVPTVKRILKPHPTKISITTKRVYIQHNPQLISATELCQLLNNANFQARIVHDGGATASSSSSSHQPQVSDDETPGTNYSYYNNDEHNRTNSRLFSSSNYVESTLRVVISNHNHNSNTHNIHNNHHNNALTATYLSKVFHNTFVIADSGAAVDSGASAASAAKAVRAMHLVHPATGVVKVEHDPSHINIQNVATQLTDAFNATGNVDVDVLMDGAIEQLYLPENRTTTSNNNENDTWTATIFPHYLPFIHNSAILSHWNVVLSGIFWIVSLIGALLENQKWECIGLLSVVFGLPPVVRKAFRTVQRCQFDANCMMVLASIGAVLIGEFDEAASVSFLFAISELLESRASLRARTALEAIIQLRPDHAAVINETTQEINIVLADQVAVDSLLSVRTGDKIAADGIVVEGTSSIDQSSLTGESVPVHVSVGSTVSGGSINIGNGRLVIRTTCTVEDSAVSRLIRLVEDAQANISPTEKMVDNFARAYTPGVLTVSAILATIPWFWGWETGKYWTLNALILIVIACPCALTISTPVTYAAGLAAAAQRGIVCKGGASLESLGSVKTVVLDKTGTITEGKFSVVALEVIGNQRTREQMLALLALMEAPSSHPLSNTLVDAAKQEGVSIPNDVDLKEHVILKGEGVTALVDNKRVYVGNKRLFTRVGMYQKLSESDRRRAECWSVDHGGTVGFVGLDDEGIVGCFCVTDVVRPEAKETIQTLQMEGINVLMLTGDGSGAAKAVAKQVGLPDSSVHSQLLPEDKLHFVGSLKSPTSRGACGLLLLQSKVLFCGDGVNDAPALAVADVGVSMGEGAALAMEMSDVTLMDSNLSKLLYVIHMGSRVLVTIRENILLSLFCKLAVVCLTFGGYMTLLYAIASDVGVMLLVTLNGMKLLPGSGEAVSLGIRKTSRFHAKKSYNVVPMTNSSSPTRVAELDSEIV